MLGRRSRIPVYLVLAIVAVLCVVFAANRKRAPNTSLRPVLPKPGPALPESSPAIPVIADASVLRAIEEKFAIDVVRDQNYPVKTYHGLILATNAESFLLDRYSSSVAREFLVYPPAFIGRSRLKRIVLCRGLSFAGQARGAIPDFEHDTLYYDIVRGDYSLPYQRHAVHHEFFHIIDYRDDGQVYSDNQWARLNPKTFHYGSGGVNMQGDPSSGLLKDIPGFLTTYATSGVEEDKAEMFAYMITDYALVENRAVTDPVIRKKMSAMKTLLERFCPAIDQKFWTEVSQRQSPSLENQQSPTQNQVAAQPPP